MADSATLLVDTSFLGDVLCVEPLIRAVAKEGDDAIDFLTSPTAKGILEGHPNLREILTFDKRGQDRSPRGLWRLATELRRRNYRRVICSHTSWRTAMLLRLSGIPERVGFEVASGSWLYTKTVPYPRHLHEVERNLQLVGGGEWSAPCMYPTSAERERVQGLLPKAGFVAVAPGSFRPTKRWPEEKFLATCKALVETGNTVVLVGGPTDVEACERIHASVLRSAGESASVQVINLAGATSMRESAALMEYATVLLSNDSFPMHLGVAAGIPVVALFCATTPALGFAPRGKHDVVVEVKNLDCRPCGIHDNGPCPKNNFRCGDELNVETVLMEINARLVPV